MEYLSKDTVLRIINNQRVVPLFYRELLQEHIKLEAPADVSEVKDGKWINIPPYRALNGQYLKGQECSVCHSFFVSEGNTPYSNHPYCCECGAKMDGEI